MRFHWLCLALCSVAAACAVDAPEEEGWSEEGKHDDPSAGGVVATHAPDVRMLDGFHALLDSSTGKCLEVDDGDGGYSVGAIEKPFELSFVSKKEDLARTLGIDASMSIKYAGASVDPTVGFLDSFKQTTSSTHLLIAARATYRVTNNRSVKLTADALGWLESDPRTFLHRCGNLYVNGVELQAQLFVLIRYDAATEEASRAISAELGLGRATAMLGLDGSVKSKLETLAKREDVTVEMRVLDRGFLVDGGTATLIGALVNSGVKAETFDKIDSVRNAMLKSISSDACRDGGRGLQSCEDRESSYETNTLRHAIPVRVDLRAYSRATNAPLGGAGSPHDSVRKLVDDAHRYLRTLSKLDAQLASIKRDEIDAFLDASPARKTLFGLAPPATFVYRVDVLTQVATKYRDAFDVTRPDSIGGKLRAKIESCWASAHDGAIEACAAPAGQTPATVAEARAAEAGIDAYVATGRVVPVRFASVGVNRWDAGRDACARKGLRLPTLAEARRLAVPIGFATMARSTETSVAHAIWHADRNTCSNGNPAFKNAPTGEPTASCLSDSLLSAYSVSTLCVPPGGPFDGLEPL